MDAAAAIETLEFQLTNREIELSLLTEELDCITDRCAEALNERDAAIKAVTDKDSRATIPKRLLSP